MALTMYTIGRLQINVCSSRRQPTPSLGKEDSFGRLLQSPPMHSLIDTRKIPHIALVFAITAIAGHYRYFGP